MTSLWPCRLRAGLQDWQSAWSHLVNQRVQVLLEVAVQSALDDACEEDLQVGLDVPLHPLQQAPYHAACTHS